MFASEKVCMENKSIIYYTFFQLKAEKYKAVLDL